MSNSLYEQLKSGTSAEDIAAAFTAELNKAEERVRVEREAEAAKQAEKATKVDDAVALLCAIVDFVSRYYPSLVPEGAELSEEDYRTLAKLLLLTLDLEAIKPAKRSFKIKNYTKPTSDIIEDDTCTATVPRAVRGQRAEANPIDEVCDPFADFFKAFGL